MLNADVADADLQDCVRKLIASGELPTSKATAIWGGYGNNDLCSICRLPILNTEIGLDMQFSQPAGPIELHVHTRCNSAWERECLAATRSGASTTIM